ncbi:MAG: AsmA family protein, partial [Saprospiraceae bacterium]|nr:AsmA family protein [Saprospiraceae bacterium]
MGEKNETGKKQQSLTGSILKILKILLIFSISLIIVLLVLIQIKPIQNFARKEIVSYLEKKLNTKVVIQDLSISFPYTIALEGIYLEDQHKDTLLASQTFVVDLNMFGLLSSDIQICEVKATGLTIHINRQRPDTVFNYQFIMDAFSPETPAKEKTPLNMAIEHIILDDTYFTYKDDLKGNDAMVYVAHFDTKIDTFDPSGLNFDVPIIKIDGIKGHVYQTSAVEIVTTAKTTETSTLNPKTVFLQLTNQQTSIKNIEFDYRNQVSAIETSFKGLSLDVFPKKLDIGSNVMAFKRIEMVDVSANIIMQSKKKSDLIKLVSSEGHEIASEYLPWKLTIDAIRLDNSKLVFDDNTKPKVSPGMDYGHLNLTRLNLEADRFFIHKDTIAAMITSGSMVDKSGFVLNSLFTDFQYTDKGVRATRLLMKTPGSELKRSVVIRYPSLDAIANDRTLIEMDILLDHSRIQVKDILYFAPFLAVRPGFEDPETIFDVDGRMYGNLRNLHFQNMQAKGFRNTRVDFSGSLTNVTDLDRVGMNLDIRNLSTTADDIRSLMPKGTIPENIRIPDMMSLSGLVNGNMTSLYSDIILKTSLGNVSAKGTIKDIKKPTLAKYDVYVYLDALDVGKLINQPDTIGAITAEFIIKGTAYDPKVAKANIDGLIKSFEYRRYVYKNINLDAQLDRMNFMANGDIRDPNIHLSFEAEGDILAVKPCIIFRANIDSIKTLPLHFTTIPFKYRGKVESYIPAFDPDTLEGYVFITESLLMANDKRIQLDSVSIIATFEKNIQSINLRSDFAQASINGKYKATQLGSIFLNAMAPYYAIRPDTISKKIDPYDFTIAADIRDHPTLRAFIPTLNRMERITLNGNFSDRDRWKGELKVPYLAFGTNIITNMNFLADTEGDVLKVVADIGKITSGENITMTGTRLDADIKDQKIDFGLRV